MKFIFDRNTLINEITIAQEIISVKSAISILSNVYLIANKNRLVIRATDLKVNFETSIAIESQEDGSITVFCDKLMGILSSLPEGDIEFNVQQKENQTIAVIRHLTQKIKYQLKCMSQDKFPDFVSTDEVKYFSLPCSDLKYLINQTSFAVSEDQTRYFMSGVYFDKKDNNLILVATDGRRLSYAETEIDNIDISNAIVHPKVLNIVAKRISEGNINIALTEKNIFFKFNNYTITSSLIDGQFPKYSRVIPENQPYEFTVSRSKLLDSLKRISTMVDKKAGRVVLNLKNNSINILSDENELGTAELEIPCQYNGDEISFIVNYKYIEDALKAINNDDIIIMFTDNQKALTIKANKNSKGLHVVMPMR